MRIFYACSVKGEMKETNESKNFIRIDGLQLRHSFFPPERLDVKMLLRSIGRCCKSTYNSFSGYIQRL